MCPLVVWDLAAHVGAGTHRRFRPSASVTTVRWRWVQLTKFYAARCSFSEKTRAGWYKWFDLSVWRDCIGKQWNPSSDTAASPWQPVEIMAPFGNKRDLKSCCRRVALAVCRRDGFWWLFQKFLINRKWTRSGVFRKWMDLQATNVLISGTQEGRVAIYSVRAAIPVAAGSLVTGPATQNTSVGLLSTCASFIGFPLRSGFFALLEAEIIGNSVKENMTT